MKRIIAVRRLSLQAAVVDWMQVARMRKGADQSWLDDLHKRNLDVTSFVQLRWLFNATRGKRTRSLSTGMPSGPFIVWVRAPSLENAIDLRFYTWFAWFTEGSGQMIQLLSEPLVYVIVELNVTGTDATLVALNGPMGLDSLESMQKVGTGMQTVILSGVQIVSVFIMSAGAISIKSVRGVEASRYANDDSWKPVEVVGLPVDPVDWASVDRHAEKQGMVGALTDPRDAAIDRLRRGAAPFGWLPTVGTNPAPVWKRPDFARLIKEIDEDVLAQLKTVLQMAPHTQSEFTLTLPVDGPQGVSGTTMSGNSDATYSPLSLLLMAGATDPLLALGTGFGTAFPINILTAVPKESFLLAMVNNPRIFDFMVTATWDKGLDGASAAVEYAALAIGVKPALPPAVPSGMLAERQTLNRPIIPDTPWTTGVRISWDRLPSLVFMRLCSFAAARAVPGTPAIEADALMRKRISGGYVPLALVTNDRNPQKNRISAVDSNLQLPMSTIPLNVRYGVAMQDIWGQWSNWMTVDHSDAQPKLERPRILACELKPIVPASGRVCAGTLVIDIAWDWSVRRPANFEFRCRLFNAPNRADTPPPDLSVPTGMQFSVDAAISGAGMVPFTGDAAILPSPGNIIVEYFDLDGNKLVTPGPVGPDDVRRYRFTISGFALDYSSVGHIGVIAWCRAQERITPMRYSDWLPSPPENKPAIAYASDPIPPEIAPLPVPRLASMPDAAGQSHASLKWPGVAGAVGYFIYEATESALITASLASPPGAAGNAEGPDISQSLSVRLDRIRTILSGDPLQRVFARLKGEMITATSADVTLPRGSKDIHFYYVIAVNAGNIESKWPGGPELATKVIRYVAPGVAIPAPPTLELQRVASGGSPAFHTAVTIQGRAGDMVERFELFRTRVEEAARTLDSMGPPVATIASTASGWTLDSISDAQGHTVKRAKGADSPAGSWKRVWYRSVAWAQADAEKGLLAGRSQSSNAMSVIIPPDGPPDLSQPDVQWPGGGLELAEVRFTSIAPLDTTPLGPHILRIEANVMAGPSHGTPADALLNASIPLNKVKTAPVATGSCLWRISPVGASPAQYVILLRRASIDDQVSIAVRMVDPLGRMTERIMQIAAGPVDPEPDVLNLDVFTIIGRGVSITWSSRAPIMLRAAGSYRLRVTIIPPATLIDLKSIRPVSRSSEVSDLLRKPRIGFIPATTDSSPASTPVVSPAARTKPNPMVNTDKIDLITGKPRPIIIDMALPDVPNAGQGEPPVAIKPWRIERQPGTRPPFGYSMFYQGKLANITVRITAPDGRFAEMTHKQR